MNTMANKADTASKGRKIVSAKPQTVRHLNRATVLDLIRQYQPVSRATLARLAGIHRSNISIIVEDLSRKGLLREEMSQEMRRGRTPTLISLDRGTVRVIAVNVRRARTTVVLASLDGHTDATYSFATPDSPDSFVDELEGAVKSLRAGDVAKGSQPLQVAQMVVSIPGILDVIGSNQATVWTPGLPKYSGVELGAVLEKRLGFPCLLANNAGLAATAALHTEEEKDSAVKDFVLLVIGDVGVGSGVVLQRHLYAGHDAAYAGEVGHTVIDPRGPRCDCGRRGCWQLYICDKATYGRYNPKAVFTPARFEEFMSAVNAGSPKALKTLRETATYLSLGISNIALMLNPEKIIIAGALTRGWDVLQRELKSVFFLPHHHAMIQPVDVPVDTLFLRGAAERAIDMVLSNSSQGTGLKAAR